MSYTRTDRPNRDGGFTYVEMLIATVIMLASLGPVIDALQSAGMAANVHELETNLHYRVLGRMEDVLAEPFDALIDAAATAGSVANPSLYSDPVAMQDRIVVLLSFYDVANTDGDGDFFTISDLNADADNNPYTGVPAPFEMAWVRVAIPGTTHAVESLSKL